MRLGLPRSRLLCGTRFTADLVTPYFLVLGDAQAFGVTGLPDMLLEHGDPDYQFTGVVYVVLRVVCSWYLADMF